jgi:hypothetical protein
MLPFLGIPGSWKNILVSLSGIFLVCLFVGPAILNKLQIKPKPKNKQYQLDSQNNELKFSALADNQTEKEKEI